MLLARRLLLGVALVLATVGLTSYLHRLRDTVPVVVTTAAVAAHTPLTADQLTVRQVNRDALQTLAGDAVTRLEDATGLVTRLDLQAGEVVRRTAWMVAVAPTGADAALPRYQLPAGMRLVGVRTDLPGAVAGRISAGDRVDVIYTSKGTQTGGLYAQTILQAAAVYAVGTKGKSDALSGTGSDLDVTLVVTPAQAQVLALAKRSGGAIDLTIAPPESPYQYLLPTRPAALQGGSQSDEPRE